MPADADRRPFGSRRAAEQEAKSRDEHDPQPVPVLHVGEVHADLRLRITEETLSDLGTQIANLIADAAYQGFRAGMETAMADAGTATPDGPPQFVSDTTGIAEPMLTHEDLRRARGQ